MRNPLRQVLWLHLAMPAIPVLEMRGLVEFVNEYADPARTVADEQDMPYPEIASIASLPDDLADTPLRELVSAADQAYRVFAAAPEGRALETLNSILRSTAPSPRATEDGIRWSVRNPRHALLGAVAICLLEWLTAHGQHRLGLCHAAKCADVYADASPAGSRRFCSSTCLNRHKVAAHRNRTRTTRGVPLYPSAVEASS